MPSLFSKQLKFTTQTLYWQNSLPAADAGNKSFLTKQPQFTNHKLTKEFSGNRQSATSNLAQGFQYDQPKQQSQTQTQPYKSLKKQFSYNTAKPTEAVNQESPAQLSTKKQSSNNSAVKLSGAGSNLSTKCFKNISIYSNSSCARKEVDASKNCMEGLSKRNENPSSSSTQTEVKDTRNIIDIPDSPCFDQLVPDELLANLSTTGNTTTKTFYQDDENMRKADKRTVNYKTSHPLSPQAVPTDFLLVDEAKNSHVTHPEKANFPINDDKIDDKMVHSEEQTVPQYNHLLSTVPRKQNTIISKRKSGFQEPSPPSTSYDDDIFPRGEPTPSHVLTPGELPTEAPYFCFLTLCYDRET